MKTISPLILQEQQHLAYRLEITSWNQANSSYYQIK